MILTTDTTKALARARNDSLDFAATKTGDTDTPAPLDKVGGLFESLAAVIPTGVAAIYTVFATTARTEMLSRGASERADYQAARLKEDPAPSSEAIAQELNTMPLESEDLIFYRWGILALAAIVVAWLAFQAVKKANDEANQKRRGWRLLFEPLTALVAITGWGLAVPGTPLGAYLNTGDLGFVSVLIAVVAGLLLLGFGVKLTEPATTTSTSSDRPVARDPNMKSTGASRPGH